MWHAHDESASTVFRCFVHAELKARDEGFTTLDTESFHRVELLTHKIGEGMRLVDALIQFQFFFLSQRVVLQRFEFETNPVTFRLVHYVHELKTDVRRVGIFKRLN